MSSHVSAERTALATELRDAGPDAPTLCAGWDTRMLLAHLVRREHSLVELGARVKIPVVTATAERAMRVYADGHEYQHMLATFSAGPPRWSPFAFGPAQEAINLLEFVIHHEDVRRAHPGTDPRQLSESLEQSVFARLGSIAHFALRSTPDQVELSWSGRQSIRVGSGQARVVVTGAPVELALVVFGRRRAARVDYSGDPDAMDRLAGAALGT